MFDFQNIINAAVTANARNTSTIMAEMFLKLCWIVWFLVSFSGVIASTNRTLSETDLHETLFNGYRPDVRPRKNMSDSLDIKMDIHIMSIEDIDEKRQTFTLRAFLEVTWKDEFLTWEPAKYGGVTSINVANSNIWLPDLALLDVYDTLTDIGQKDGRTVIDHEGSVVIWPFKMYTVGCKMKIRRFPFDTQTCILDFISWTNPVSVLDLKTSDTLNLERYSENAEWALESYESVHYLLPYGDDAWAHIKYVFVLRRKYLFQVINVIAPIVVISLLNVTCFVLPAECGEKIGLCITIFLTLAVFLTIITSSMPESSDEFSVLGLYVGLQLLGSAMTILATVVSLCLFNRDKSVRVPLVLRFLSKFCSRTPKRPSEEEDDTKVTENGVKFSTCRSETEITWVMASHAFDRLCMWIAICWHISLFSGFLVGTIA